MKIVLGLAFLALAAPALADPPPIDQLRPDRPTVSGMLSKTAIHQVVFLHRSEIRQCYETGLKVKPGLAGKLVAQFVIDVTGSVSHVKIASSTVNDSNVQNCVVNRVSRWRFPRPAKGTVAVTYPWMLRPASASNG